MTKERHLKKVVIFFEFLKKFLLTFSLNTKSATYILLKIVEVCWQRNNLLCKARKLRTVQVLESLRTRNLRKGDETRTATEGS